MADNYLEKKYEDLQARKAREQRSRQLAWKKRMDAYRRRLAGLEDESVRAEGKLDAGINAEVAEN